MKIFWCAILHRTPKESVVLDFIFVRKGYEGEKDAKDLTGLKPRTLIYYKRLYLVFLGSCYNSATRPDP